MCLGIPGRVESIHRTEPLLMGQVSFGGVQREVCLEHVPEVEVGEYVLVHVGFALTRLDEEEAQRVFALLDELAAASEWSEGEVTEGAAHQGKLPEGSAEGEP